MLLDTYNLFEKCFQQTENEVSLAKSNRFLHSCFTLRFDSAARLVYLSGIIALDKVDNVLAVLS